MLWELNCIVKKKTVNKMKTMAPRVVLIHSLVSLDRGDRESWHEAGPWDEAESWHEAGTWDEMEDSSVGGLSKGMSIL